MSETKSVELIRRGHEAFLAGDMETVAALFAENLVWHDAGRSAISGDKHGRAAVMEHIQRLGELTDGTFSFELHDVVGNDTHVVVLATILGRRNGKDLRANHVGVWHMEGAQTVEYWSNFVDQYAADDFWS
jgi:uncharacterized protein